MQRQNLTVGWELAKTKLVRNQEFHNTIVQLTLGCVNSHKNDACDFKRDAG